MISHQESEGRRAYHILIIEDDEATQTLLRIWLGRAGYNCVCLINAKQVLDYLVEERPNLILMDIRLPGGVNGIELTRIIKTQDCLKHIPIIILTVDGYEKKRAMEAGASSYLLKPISKKYILEEIMKNLHTEGLV